MLPSDEFKATLRTRDFRVNLFFLHDYFVCVRDGFSFDLRLFTYLVLKKPQSPNPIRTPKALRTAMLGGGVDAGFSLSSGLILQQPRSVILRPQSRGRTRGSGRCPPKSDFCGGWPSMQCDSQAHAYRRDGA